MELYKILLAVLSGVVVAGTVVVCWLRQRAAERGRREKAVGSTEPVHVGCSSKENKAEVLPYEANLPVNGGADHANNGKNGFQPEGSVKLNNSGPLDSESIAPHNRSIATLGRSLGDAEMDLGSTVITVRHETTATEPTATPPAAAVYSPQRVSPASMALGSAKPDRSALSQPPQASSFDQPVTYRQKQKQSLLKLAIPQSPQARPPARGYPPLSPAGEVSAVVPPAAVLSSDSELSPSSQAGLSTHTIVTNPRSASSPTPRYLGTDFVSILPRDHPDYEATSARRWSLSQDTAAHRKSITSISLCLSDEADTEPGPAAWPKSPPASAAHAHFPRPNGFPAGLRPPAVQSLEYEEAARRRSLVLELDKAALHFERHAARLHTPFGALGSLGLRLRPTTAHDCSVIVEGIKFGSAASRAVSVLLDPSEAATRGKRGPRAKKRARRQGVDDETALRYYLGTWTDSNAGADGGNWPPAKRVVDESLLNTEQARKQSTAGYSEEDAGVGVVFEGGTDADTMVPSAREPKKVSTDSGEGSTVGSFSEAVIKVDTPVPTETMPSARHRLSTYSDSTFTRFSSHIQQQARPRQALRVVSSKPTTFVETTPPSSDYDSTPPTASVDVNIDQTHSFGSSSSSSSSEFSPRGPRQKKKKSALKGGTAFERGDLILSADTPNGTWPVFRKEHLMTALGPRGQVYEGSTVELVVARNPRFITTWRLALESVLSSCGGVAAIPTIRSPDYVRELLLEALYSRAE
ncbi:hypothetical protein DIPPA_08633 [Diplonema papillatum]|nr:hypothetical protein DIPPA_08633 [Diplonema papillatum]